MKKGMFTSKSIFLLVFFLFSIATTAQEQKETRKERKEREKKEQAALYEVAKQLILDSAFIIPADRITLKSGITGIVQNNINFVKVYKKIGVLQISPSHSSELGLNGLGGFTIKGDITKYEVTDKGNKIYVRIYLKAPLANAVINISLFGSTSATVDVSGMFKGSAFTLYGNINLLGNVRIFEGTSF